MKKLSILLLFLILVPLNSWATSYYFAQSGNDSTGDGSQGNPWKTITKANSSMAALADGTHSILFNRGDTWELGGGEATALLITVSGTDESNRVTVGAYGTGNKPKIDGNAADDGGVVQADDQSHFIIENLEVYGGHAGNSVINIPHGYNRVTQHDMIIQDCIIHGALAGNHVIHIKNTAVTPFHDIIIRRNVVYDSGHNGIKVSDGVTYCYIYENTIYNITHNGIDTLDIENSNTNNYLEIYSNDIYDCSTGIYACDVTYTNIYDNDIYNMSLKEAGISSYGVKVAQQVSAGSDHVIVRNNRVWNVVNAGLSTYAIWMTYTTNKSCWNNTVYGCTNTMYHDGSISNYNNLAYANVSDSADLRNYGSDPKFVSVVTPDFHLQSNSPVIDQGVDVGLPYSGEAPDLGAYEYGVTIPSLQGVTIIGGTVK